MNWLGLNGVLNEWSRGYRATEVGSLKSDVRPLTPMMEDRMPN